MQRIPVLTQSGQSTCLWMAFNTAVAKLRAGEIDEFYSTPGKPETFKGVILRESKVQERETFVKPSLDTSAASITDGDCEANAGAADRHRVIVAREKVTSWPYEHDQNNVVISAGIAYGVYCPLFDTNVHTPNFA